jgi:hypothetical protein
MGNIIIMKKIQNEILKELINTYLKNIAIVKYIYNTEQPEILKKIWMTKEINKINKKILKIKN